MKKLFLMLLSTAVLTGCGSAKVNMSDEMKINNPIDLSKEDGADSIDGINYLNCPEWSMDYEEDTNSIGFEDFIDDVVDNKVSEYPYLKTVIIDTYDQLLEIAKPEVIRMHNAENPEKPVKSIKAAFGGYMAGEDKASEIVLDKLWSLKRVGVHFIIIGHVKQKRRKML